MLEQKTIFITGTDTSVGKSIFTAVLALALFNQGKKIAISKPIQTGLPRDTDFLTELTGSKIPVFNTYSFMLSAAPVVAAKEENKNIDIQKVVSDIRSLEKEFDHVIVEGIGGIAVPVEACQRWHGTPLLVADLIKDLNYPVVIISRPTLGTINHTILTIGFAKQKKINILGFVISGYDEKINDVIIKTAPEVISNITQIKCLMKLPIFKEISFASISRSLPPILIKSF